MNKLRALGQAFRNPRALWPRYHRPDDGIPAWRHIFVLPHWARVILAIGPLSASRAFLDPKHAVRRKRLIHDCIEARAAWVNWMKSLSQQQRDRYFWSLPRVKWTPPRISARIIRPLEFHPELARRKREDEQIKAWALLTGRDPVQCPIFLERVRRVQRRLERPVDAAND